jgi:hypothetical protein
MVQPLFEQDEIAQFRCHVNVYAGLLYNWQLYHKRLELLKAITMPKQQTAATAFSIGSFFLPSCRFFVANV